MGPLGLPGACGVTFPLSPPLREHLLGSGWGQDRPHACRGGSPPLREHLLGLGWGRDRPRACRGGSHPLREHLLGSGRQVSLTILDFLEELLQLLIPFLLGILEVLLTGLATL